MTILRHAGAAALLVLVSGSLSAQSIADRVARAPDGKVRFSYAAREGVCGNGRNNNRGGGVTQPAPSPTPVGQPSENSNAERRRRITTPPLSGVPPTAVSSVPAEIKLALHANRRRLLVVVENDGNGLSDWTAEGNVKKQGDGPETSPALFTARTR